MSRGKSLAFRAWSPDDRLMLGPLGILEPSPAAAELVPDIMLVPLAAFDRRGHRIGYGAGHYDYTLAHLRKMQGRSPPSASPSPSRKLRRFPRCRTTWRWIMC